LVKENSPVKMVVKKGKSLKIISKLLFSGKMAPENIGESG
jgi:hypothetical protein